VCIFVGLSPVVVRFLLSFLFCVGFFFSFTRHGFFSFVLPSYVGDPPCLLGGPLVFEGFVYGPRPR